jgi:hypothetical protein
MKTIKLILFCLIFWLTFIFGYDALASSKRFNKVYTYRAADLRVFTPKQNKVYKQRNYQCREAQYRIQTKGQTHYKKNNKWQPRTTRRSALRK